LAAATTVDGASLFEAARWRTAGAVDLKGLAPELAVWEPNG
jgi:hypothetical protein